MISPITLRRNLAFLRLALHYTLFCFWTIYLGLAWRADREGSARLVEPLPPAEALGVQIPLVGINVALEQYNQTERRVALQRLQEAGFGWVRQRLDWSALEPTPGQFSWQLSDDLLADIRATALEPVVVLDGSPVWARADQDAGNHDNPLAPPASSATFARFVTAFAKRYRDQVQFYQIWDEPNIAPHWGVRHIEPVDYALLLKAAASAIRNTDRDAVMIAGALAPTRDRGHAAIDEVYFLQRLYAAGAAPYFDVVAVQPFGFGYAATDDRARADILNFQRVKLVRQAMIAAGDGATPIWAVRFGWNIHPASPWGIVKTSDQLQFARESVSIARTEWPWLTALGWAIDQPPYPKDDPLWGFALTPELVQALESGDKETRRWGDGARGKQEGWWEQPFSSLWMLGLVCLLIVWRISATVSLLPWRGWGQRYRSWPPVLRLSCWGGLIILYYLATWPPLILLCLLAGGLFAAWEPAVGLWLAALLIPFYFQHKEVQWGELQLTIAPAYALLFCLAPALSTHLYSALFETQSFPCEIGLKNSGLQINRSIKINSLIALGESVTRRGLRRVTDSPRAELVFGRLLSITSGGWARPWCWSRRNGNWLALAWFAINLAASYHVWYWPAYRLGLLEMALLPLLLYGAVRLLIETPEERQQLLFALFMGGVGVAGVGLFAWLQGEGTAVDGVLRLVGPYFSPNHTALYLERSLFIGLGLAFRGPKSLRYASGAGCVLVIAALFLTGSRGAWLLGVPAGVAVFIWLQNRQAKLRANPETPESNGGATEAHAVDTIFREGLADHLVDEHDLPERFADTPSSAQTAYCASPDAPSSDLARQTTKSRRRVQITPKQGRHLARQWIVLTLVALVALGLSVALFWERLTNSATLLQRLQVWQTATRMWLDFPLVGVGPGGFFWRYPAYIQTFGAPEPNLLHPHNLWLEFATHWGILGLLWLAWLVASLITAAFSSKAQSTQIIADNSQLATRNSQLFALIASLAHAQVDAFMVLPDLALWNWLVLALLMAI